MKIDQLKVTQCGLRNKSLIAGMVEFVKNNGRFNKEALTSYVRDNPGAYHSPLIEIVQFPDGELFIGDGHHRILAISMAGREFLYEDEYRLVSWSYEEYLEINFDQKWVTPFDPHTHNRLPDFLEFKVAVREKLQSSEQAAVEYIEAHPEEYMKEKQYDDIVSLGRDIGFDID